MWNWYPEFAAAKDLAVKKTVFIIVGWLLVHAGFSHARSLDLFESWSIAAHGGLESTNFYNAGLQVMTLSGPGDSSYIMCHSGFGLDLTYAHDGAGLHHLRIVPAAEFMLFWFYAQLGLGAFVDLQNPDKWGFNLAFNFGLRLFLGDEYQAPSFSAGGRLDYMVSSDYQEFVPAFMAMLSFYID